MTPILAIVDYIPVIMFGVTGIIIMRDIYNKCSKGAFALVSAGTIMVLWAGAYKATWKLLYTLNVADFFRMNQQFLPMQAAGFLLMGLGLMAATFLKQGKGKQYSFLMLPMLAKVIADEGGPEPQTGAMFFIVFMVLGLLGVCVALSVIAARMKKPISIIFFVVSFILLLAMGYLGSREFGSDPIMNWVEECINIAAQICLLAGVVILDKSGLKERESLK
ncbi:MAG: hypothetical protein IJ788_02455 [Oscillospiraceae bacterium]|nr:hypothetical protein [Oscillospiraceae bacterium]